MRIKTQFKIISSIVIALIFAISVFLFYQITELREEIEKNKVASEMMKGVFELNFLLNDYLQNPGERSIGQWQSRHQSIEALLNLEIFHDLDEQTIIKNLNNNHESIQLTFSQLAETTEVRSQELQERLTSELLIKSTTMVADTSQLLEHTRIEQSGLQDRLIMYIAISIGILAAIIISVFLVLSKTILKPLSIFQRGANKIGEGNLKYKIETNHNKNEIYDLAMSFNEMTTKLNKAHLKLKQKIGELEKAIVERKKTEHTLKERMKELNIIYQTSKFLLGKSLDQSEALAEIVKRIPPAFQFPEIACAKITYDGNEYKTPNFKKTKWGQSTTIEISGKEIGKIEVFYLEKKDFIPEETKMLKEVASQIGNISERKKSEDRIKALDKLKSRFITALSHVTRTPLNKIRWAIESMLSGDIGKMTEEQQSFLRQILEHDDQILRVITNMNIILDIERGTMVLEKDSASILSLAKSVMDSFQEECKLRNLQCSISSSQEEYPSLQVDSEKLRKAMELLLDNGLKYSKEKGEVSMELSKSVDWITLKVIDKGVGIPKAEQSNVYSRFFRASNAATMHPDGIGIGLYIAKAIVEAHNGQIGFESEEGKGSTFWIKLPIK